MKKTTTILKPFYDVYSFLSVKDATKSFDITKVDVVIADLDMMKSIHQNNPYKGIVYLGFAATEDDLHTTDFVEYGVDDLIRVPLIPNLLLRRLKIYLELKELKHIDFNKSANYEETINQRISENQLLFDLSIDIITQLVEARDTDTLNHILRTKSYYGLIMQALKLNPKYKHIVDDTYIAITIKACPLHDIGKIGIPDQILNKGGVLSPAEYGIIKTHTEIGYQAIKRALENSFTEGLIDKYSSSDTKSFFIEAMNMTLYHHERYDGAGYPKMLHGDEIPLSAQVMALIDVFDALTTQRVYKDAWPIDKAVDYIKSESGKQFAPDIVLAFIEKYTEFINIWSTYKE
ncbi:MAG: HD domain-containing phosphohydrolase [Erysipelotrichaceae bacterium]